MRTDKRINRDWKLSIPGLRTERCAQDNSKHIITKRYSYVANATSRCTSNYSNARSRVCEQTFMNANDYSPNELRLYVSHKLLDYVQRINMYKWKYLLAENIAKVTSHIVRWAIVNFQSYNSLCSWQLIRNYLFRYIYTWYYLINKQPYNV